MTPSPRDDASFDRLLDGTVAPGDVPAELAEVARLVRAARGPATAEELRTAAAIAAAVPTVGAVVPLREARPRGRRALVRLAIVGGVVLVGATAAAATGNLPAPVQSAVSSAAERVGLDVPDGEPPPPADDPALPGPDVPPEQARPALCAAWAQDGKPKRGTAFDRLERAAGQGGVDEYCADVLTTVPVSPGGPGGSTGKPADTPAATGGPDGSTGKPEGTPGTTGGPDGSTGEPADTPGKPADTPGTTATPPSSGPPSSDGRPDGAGPPTKPDAGDREGKADRAPQP
jgi:hypothetical protein